MDLGGTIRKYRLLNGLKQSELAKMLHVSIFGSVRFISHEETA